MFSTTTIASSTGMPIEKISANRDTRFSVKPQAQDANSVTVSVGTTAVPTIAASRRPSPTNTSASTERVANSSFWISFFALSSAVAPSLRVLATSTPSGITVLRSAATRAITASATSIALVPGFLVAARVTAGCSAIGCPSRAASPCQTYRVAGGGPSRTVATSRRNTGRPARTPTTSSSTSRASRRYGPDSSAIARLPAIRSPTGSPRFAP